MNAPTNLANPLTAPSPSPSPSQPQAPIPTGNGAPKRTFPSQIDGFGDNGINAGFGASWQAFLSETQGNILKSHGREHTRFLFIRFDLRTIRQQEDTCKLIELVAKGLADVKKPRFLKNTANLKRLVEIDFKITSALEQDRQTFVRENAGSNAETPLSPMHVGFLLSAAGYRALGFSESELPDDEGFKRGMKHPATSEYLSDPPADSEWEPAYRDAIHAMLILADDDEKRLAEIEGIISELIQEYGVLVRAEKGSVIREGAHEKMKLKELKDLPSKEHFGFRDGLSQPLFLKDDILKARMRGLLYFLTLPIRLELEGCEAAREKIGEARLALAVSVEEAESRAEKPSTGKDTIRDARFLEQAGPRKADLDHQMAALGNRIAELNGIVEMIKGRMDAFFLMLEELERDLAKTISQIEDTGLTSELLDQIAARIWGESDEDARVWKARLAFLRNPYTGAMGEDEAKAWEKKFDENFGQIEARSLDLKSLADTARKEPEILKEVFFKSEVRRSLLNLKAQLAQIGRTQWDPSAPLGLVFKRESAQGPGFGSFFVFRKLKQDVEAFRKLARNRAARKTPGEGYAPAGATQAELAELEEARMVGRSKNGCPLAWGESGSASVAHPEQPENFNYTQDTQGKQCPFHAHIRTVNPRGSTGSTYDERSRRIARRGVPYQEGEEKGLLFLCAQSDIREQFEYIQKLWANNPDFPPNVYPSAGLDPIIGQKRGPSRNDAAGRGNGYGSAAGDYGVVTLKGGEYFFAPSLPFLKNLAPRKNSPV